MLTHESMRYKIYWKEKETHILNFKTADLHWEHHFFLYEQFIPLNTNIRLYFLLMTRSICHDVIATHRCGLTNVKKPKLGNKILSKEMNRWIVFRIKIVSLITHNDNAWPTFPIRNKFDDMNKEFVFYVLLINETLCS